LARLFEEFGFWSMSRTYWVCKPPGAVGYVAFVTYVDRELATKGRDMVCRIVSGVRNIRVRMIQRCAGHALAAGETSPFPGERREKRVRNLFQILERIATNNYSEPVLKSI